MKGSLKEEDMETMTSSFIRKYTQIVGKLRKRIDAFHVKLREDEQDFVVEDLTTEAAKFNPSLRKITRKLRAKWQMFCTTMANAYNDKIKCKITECISVKRVNYILQTFEKYFKTETKLKDINEDNEDDDKKEEDDPDFIWLYNNKAHKKLTSTYPILLLLISVLYSSFKTKIRI